MKARALNAALLAGLLSLGFGAGQVLASEDENVCDSRDCNGGSVPELDAGSATVALGLLVGIGALIRERSRRK